MGREVDSGWGTHVYLWRIHFDIWQNQHNIVKFKNKILKKFVFSWETGYFFSSVITVSKFLMYLSTGLFSSIKVEGFQS